MDNNQLLGREDLVNWFRPTGQYDPKIGIEIELGAMDPQTGKSVPYGGSNGSRAMLEAIWADDDWTPIVEGDALLGIKRHDGTLITLEHGGALEYSSIPMASIGELVRIMQQDLLRFAQLVEKCGSSLLAFGNTPFDTRADSVLVPKTRARIMGEYCASLGEEGSMAWRIMMQALSTQVTYDFASEDDMSRKMRALVPAAPVSTALFANSPIQDGIVDGVLSHRARAWLQFDPRRCGPLPMALKDTMTFDEYVNWLLDVPMMFSAEGGQYLPMHGRTFREVWERAHEDLPHPTVSLWNTHLSAIFTDIRLRKTIEIRAIDGQSFADIPAVPAFWTGIIYHPPSLEAVWNLFRHKTVRDVRKAEWEVCQKGLNARYGNDSVRELATQMLDFARQGLRARIAMGLEDAKVLQFLEPLEEIISTGNTRAEQVIQRWNNEFACSPAKFIATYGIKEQP
jgi:glutamate--cysteine ligase